MAVATLPAPMEVTPALVEVISPLIASKIACFCAAEVVNVLVETSTLPVTVPSFNTTVSISTPLLAVFSFIWSHLIVSSFIKHLSISTPFEPVFSTILSILNCPEHVILPNVSTLPLVPFTENSTGLLAPILIELVKFPTSAPTVASKVAFPTTARVPAIAVLPVSAATVNLLVFTSKAPVERNVPPTTVLPVAWATTNLSVATSRFLAIETLPCKSQSWFACKQTLLALVNAKVNFWSIWQVPAITVLPVPSATVNLSVSTAIPLLAFNTSDKVTTPDTANEPFKVVAFGVPVSPTVRVPFVRTLPFVLSTVNLPAPTFTSPVEIKPTLVTVPVEAVKLSQVIASAVISPQRTFKEPALIPLPVSLLISPAILIPPWNSGILVNLWKLVDSCGARAVYVPDPVFVNIAPALTSCVVVIFPEPGLNWANLACSAAVIIILSV